MPTASPRRNPEQPNSGENPDTRGEWDGVSALALFFLAAATRIDGGTEATAREIEDCARCRGWDGLAAHAARGLPSRVVADAFVTAAYDVFVGSPFIGAFADVLGSPSPGAEADTWQERWCADQPDAEHGGHADASAIVGTLAGMVVDVEHPPAHLCLFLLVQYLRCAVEARPEDFDRFGHRLLEELALGDVLSDEAIRAPRVPARAA
ncbi:MAG: hypothetical protein RLP09_50360 [Sandaracinaceae bacterium]